MSAEERQKILKMVEDGKISADEAMKLMKALDESSVEMEVVGAAPASSSGPEVASDSKKPKAPEFEEVSRRARRLWQIPLWIGVLITVLSAYWMYVLVSTSNYGFWFYFAWLPLLVGILMIALFASSKTSRWLYVNVEQAEGEWPRNITLGIPLPLGLASWFLRNFGHNIEGLRQANINEIVEILSTGVSIKEPLIVNVDEGEHGERVQVYIG
jgi:SHOCT-like domain